MWLIEENAGRVLADARERGINSLTHDQIVAFEKETTAASGDPRNVVRAGSTMEIRVEGTLTERPDLFAAWFGGGNTTYDSITKALALAATDSSVRDVVLRVSSPGGQVDGLFEALSAIESFRDTSGKKIKTIATKAQSAAYAIAAASGNIIAANSASMFGSIGTAIDFVVNPNMKVVSITNSDSPAKRPDPTTDEGRAEIVRFLDQVNELFVRAIASGREVESSEVTEKFGRGASFVADEAKRRGMVDAIANPMSKKTSGARGRSTTADDGEGKEVAMDLATLKAQHPAVYQAAVAEGENQERDRVVAHLTLGEQSGDMKTASDAIRAGEGMTQTITAKYLAAGMNRSDRTVRQSEGNDVREALSNADKTNVSTRDLGDAVADRLLGGV